MPRRDHCPLPGVYSGFDVTPWAGVDVCEVDTPDAPTITVPALGGGQLGDPDQPGEGEYVDVIELMTGFGSDSSATLSGRLTAAWASIGGAGTIAATLDGSDRLAITNGGVADLTIAAGSPGAAAWGIDAAGLSVPAGTTVVAPGEWERGVTDPSDYLLLQRAGSPDTIPVTVHRVQDRRIALREREDLLDADDLARWCLEHGDDSVRWGVTADGRAWWATTGAADGMIWHSSTFRDRLGFSGNETIQTWGAGAGIITRGQIADHPLPGVVHPTRPLRRQTPRSESVGEEQRLVGGGYSSVHVHTVKGWRIEMWVDGPLDSGLDLHRHWLDMMTDPALCNPGRRITLYQDVGDSRRALDPRRVTADQPAYDTLYTSEEGPYRGRIVGFVNPATGREIEAEQEGRYRRRYPVSFVMDEEV